MRIKLFYYGAIAALVLAWCVRTGTCEEKTPAQRTTESIEELVLTSHILNQEEVDQLVELLTGMPAIIKDEGTLSEIAIGITRKVISDRANLQFLLLDLDILANDPYASRVGKFKPAATQTSWSKLHKLNSDMERLRPAFDKPDASPDAKDYLTIADQNVLFLTGGKRAQTIADVWSEIQVSIARAYPLWEAEYNELVAKIVAAPDKQPEDVIDAQALVFVKAFGRVVMYCHKLKGTLGDLESLTGDYYEQRTPPT